METVWLLHHTHELLDGREDVKLIGVFASMADGCAAIEQVAMQPGFRELPEGFSLTEHYIGTVHWGEGFVTVD
ncbi:MAG: hypothetical protein IPL70_01705 [Uliginosibacterium sp.]|nr:hypothetical protein [Uliginosibacterium sp.]MBK9394147.1 hypothetical protein [Uliginosibacterium sp.]